MYTAGIEEELYAVCSPKRLAVLTGWPYYRGRVKFHDLRAVMTKYIALALTEKLVLFNKQWECKEMYTILELSSINRLCCEAR